VTSIHFDTLVFLSPALWHIHKMRRYWVSRGKKMSIYLAIEMLVGFFKTNNPLRFHRFAELVYRKTIRTRRVGIPKPSSFLREFERHLIVTYGGWNGTKDRNDKAEGAMRTQPCTIHPQTDWAQDSALIFWMRLSCEIQTKFKDREPSDTEFVKYIRDIKKSMIGLGDLFSQKLLFGAAAIGLNIPSSFFKHCLPGSMQHMKVLRKPPYNFVRPDQVKQLVTSISVKGNLVPEVAEEIICLRLKGPTSLSLYQEVSVKGCDLFSAVYSQDREIEIRRLDNASKRQMPATRGGFSNLSTSGYFPEWARHKDVSKYCLNHVRMSSEANFRFSIERSSTSQLKALEKEPLHFESLEADFSSVQGLLHSNKYVHLNDPIGELAKYLQVTRNQLVGSISLRRKGSGYLPFLDVSSCTNLKVDVRFLQIDEIATGRRPIIDVLNTTKSDWCYRTKNGACLSLFLHCISNLHLRHKDHWSIAYLKHAKELLLLIPLSLDKDSCAVVGVLFRTMADDRIRLRQISNRCRVLPPMVIAVDYNGFFDKRREQLFT
jgi:hypothetical protein